MTNYRVSTFPLSEFALGDFLGDLADSGISSIELGSPHFQALDAPTAASLQAESGLPFRSMLTTANTAGPEGLEEQMAVLDIAQKLSIPTVSVSSGGSEDSDEAEIELIIDRLKTLTQEAENRNLKLSFYSHRGWMAYNLERCERIFDAIQSDSFGYYYCPYHFHIAGDDPVVALERLAERLSSVYFDCGWDFDKTTAPLWEQEELDYRAVCQAIQKAGFEGEIMLIYFAEKAETPEPMIRGIRDARATVDELMA